MTLEQTGYFLAILSLVTLRTLGLRHSVSHISPNAIALIIGLGTTLVCLALLPLSMHTDAVVSFGWNDIGVAVGLTKGGLLTLLLIAQQQLIGRSLSATIYVFPIAVGAIAVTEMLVFNTPLSHGGMAAIGVLFTAGVGFSVFGHLGMMPFSDKLRFALMIILVVGFSLCDKIGIPRLGWFGYLLFTGIGNLLSSMFMYRRVSMRNAKACVGVAVIWVGPELFFNFSLAKILPVSYGYLAIALRVPIMLTLAVLFYREGKISSQLLFGFISLLGTIMLFTG